MLKKLPDAEVSWRNALYGGFLSAILFIIGEYALGIYFGLARPSSAYGVTGSIILLMLWVSYSAAILLLGAEFSKELQNNSPVA
jgi:membrane protein